MVSDAAIIRLATALAEIEVLKTELKRRSMIYQYEEKVAAASFLGLTFDEVNVAYVDWARIRTEYHRRLAKAHA